MISNKQKRLVLFGIPTLLILGFSLFFFSSHSPSGRSKHTIYPPRPYHTPSSHRPTPPLSDRGKILHSMAALDISRDLYLDLLELDNHMPQITSLLNRCNYYGTNTSNPEVRDFLQFQIGHRPDCPGFKSEPGWIQVAVTPQAVVNDCTLPLFEYFPRFAALQSRLCEFAALIPVGLLDHRLRTQFPGGAAPRALGAQTCNVISKFQLPCNHMADATLPPHDGYAVYSWHNGLRDWYDAHRALRPDEIEDARYKDKAISLLDATDEAFRALFEISLHRDFNIMQHQPGDFLGSSVVFEHKLFHTQARLHTLLYVYFISHYQDFCPFSCEGFAVSRCWAFLFERSMNWLAFAQQHFYSIESGTCQQPNAIAPRFKRHKQVDWNHRIDRLYDEYIALVREKHELGTPKT
eukprot:gnl/Trimastix_PCT/3679.p1 GENE.gnl/Trimastix_PCT/3679~~gnl/Trimastix_PCT/3679.p1  ORF type:complete len:407 (+),score=79.83 gnl/Trimastix_PCT/3679:33-1253(+)